MSRKPSTMHSRLNQKSQTTLTPSVSHLRRWLSRRRGPPTLLERNLPSHLVRLCPVGRIPRFVSLSGVSLRIRLLASRLSRFRVKNQIQMGTNLLERRMSPTWKGGCRLINGRTQATVESPVTACRFHPHPRMVYPPESQAKPFPGDLLPRVSAVNPCQLREIPKAVAFVDPFRRI